MSRGALTIALVVLVAGSPSLGFAHPPLVTPRVIICFARIRGALSPEMIRRVATLHRPEIRTCYTRQLIAHPQLAGRVTVRFVIAPGGTVKNAVLASSDLGSPAVDDCVLDHVRHWNFPAVDGGSAVVVEYPFRFESLRF